MPLAATWHCAGTLVTTVLTEDCTVTSYANATTTPATSTPLYIQDAGNISYGLAWLVFFAAMIFLGMVWNALPFNLYDK
jgi:hypothetical protein